MGVQLLDCTLRDGCHVIRGQFGKPTIRNIISSLLQSGIDIIELGFLKNGSFSEDQAYYNRIEPVYEHLSNIPIAKEGSEYSLMIRPDWYDMRQLSPCNGQIQNIRFAFYYENLSETVKAVENAANKGYQFALNPVNIMGYDQKKLSEVIRCANKLRPSMLTIVDTFGSMLPDDLVRIHSIMEEQLDSEIGIGLHLHENLSLSFALALQFLKSHAPQRDIVIDGSLNGMGRIPGNLCIEMISEYMNRFENTQYKLLPLLDSIDRDIMQFKAKNPWGYSTPYFLSANHNMHRSYAEYLLGKENIKTKDIESLFRKIPEEEKPHFHKDIIEKLYCENNKEDNLKNGD